MMPVSGIEAVHVLSIICHWFATMTANSVSNALVCISLIIHRSHSAYMKYIHSDNEQARALDDELVTLANGLAKTGLNVTTAQERVNILLAADRGRDPTSRFRKKLSLRPIAGGHIEA